MSTIMLNNLIIIKKVVKFQKYNENINYFNNFQKWTFEKI